MTKTLKGVDAQVQVPARACGNGGEGLVEACELSGAEAGPGGGSGPPGPR